MGELTIRPVNNRRFMEVIDFVVRYEELSHEAVVKWLISPFKISGRDLATLGRLEFFINESNSALTAALVDLKETGDGTFNFTIAVGATIHEWKSVGIDITEQTNVHFGPEVVIVVVFKSQTTGTQHYTMDASIDHFEINSN
jgi:hypothetical protein